MDIKTLVDAQDAELTIFHPEDIFRDLLNTTEKTIKICNLEWQAGDVLEQIDSLAFRLGASDYADAKCGDNIWTELDDGTLVDTHEIEEAQEDV